MNKIIVSSKALSTILNHVKRVKKHSLLPITENILMTIEDGMATITCNNVDVQLSASLYVHQVRKKPFKMLFPTKDVSAYLNLIPEQPISITWNDNTIEISDDGGIAKFKGDDPDDFPAPPITSLKEEVLIGILKKPYPILNDIAKYVDTDELRPAMNGAAMLDNDGKMMLAATDGYMLKLNYTDIDSIDDMGIIGHQAIKLLATTRTNELRISKVGTDLDDSHLFNYTFKGFDFTLISKSIGHRFPDVKAVIPKDTLIKYTVDSEMMQLALKKAAIIYYEHTKHISLDLHVINTIKVENWDDSTEATITCGGTLDGDNIKIGFNCSLLQRAIKGFKNPIMEITTKTKSVVIKDETQLALVMPVMIS